MNRELHLAGVMGALVGDALGVPFEFKRPEDIPAPDEINMVMPASFDKTYSAIPYGTWSDDGSQLLCLLEALQDCEIFDPARFAELLTKWRHHAYHQAGGSVFDCGGQTRQAIRQLVTGITPIEAGGTDEKSNGNGSLMRTLPVAIIGHLKGWDSKGIAAIAHLHSHVTHGHPKSQVCCALYSLMAASLLTDPSLSITDCYRSAFTDLTEMYATREYAEHAIALADIDEFPKTNFARGSGYVVDTLWTSIDSLDKSDSYVGAVRRAISYGNDSDTTACVAGGLAGIKYGIDGRSSTERPIGIPSDWISILRMTEEATRVLGKLS